MRGTSQEEGLSVQEGPQQRENSGDVRGEGAQGVPFVHPHVNSTRGSTWTQFDTIYRADSTPGTVQVRYSGMISALSLNPTPGTT